MLHLLTPKANAVALLLLLVTGLNTGVSATPRRLLGTKGCNSANCGLLGVALHPIPSDDATATVTRVDTPHVLHTNIPFLLSHIHPAPAGAAGATISKAVGISLGMPLGLHVKKELLLPEAQPAAAAPAPAATFEIGHVAGAAVAGGRKLQGAETAKTFFHPHAAAVVAAAEGLLTVPHAIVQVKKDLLLPHTAAGAHTVAATVAAPAATVDVAAAAGGGRKLQGAETAKTFFHPHAAVAAAPEGLLTVPHAILQLKKNMLLPHSHTVAATVVAPAATVDVAAAAGGRKLQGAKEAKTFFHPHAAVAEVAAAAAAEGAVQAGASLPHAVLQLKKYLLLPHLTASAPTGTVEVAAQIGGRKLQGATTANKQDMFLPHTLPHHMGNTLNEIHANPLTVSVASAHDGPVIGKAVAVNADFSAGMHAGRKLQGAATAQSADKTQLFLPCALPHHVNTTLAGINGKPVTVNVAASAGASPVQVTKTVEFGMGFPKGRKLQATDSAQAMESIKAVHNAQSSDAAAVADVADAKQAVKGAEAADGAIKSAVGAAALGGLTSYVTSGGNTGKAMATAAAAGVGSLATRAAADAVLGGNQQQQQAQVMVIPNQPQYVQPCPGGAVYPTGGGQTVIVQQPVQQESGWKAGDVGSAVGAGLGAGAVGGGWAGAAAGLGSYLGQG